MKLQFAFYKIRLGSPNGAFLSAMQPSVSKTNNYMSVFSSALLIYIWSLFQHNESNKRTEQYPYYCFFRISHMSNFYSTPANSKVLTPSCKLYSSSCPDGWTNSINRGNPYFPIPQIHSKSQPLDIGQPFGNMNSQQIDIWSKSTCIDQKTVCNDWINYYNITPFVSFGKLPDKLIPSFVAMNCFFWAKDVIRWTPVACYLIAAQYGIPNSSDYNENSFPDISNVHPSVCNNWGKFCKGWAVKGLKNMTSRPFYSAFQASNTSKSIDLSGKFYNVNASAVIFNNGSAPLNGWNLLNTPVGNIIRAGNGTSIKSNILSQATMRFSGKGAVEVQMNAV